MIIPKEFEGLEDLEAMLLTSILGTLEALKEDLISFKQAESYWLSGFTSELFEALNLSEDLVSLINESLSLKDLQPFTTIYQNKLNELLATTKKLIASHYTEYSTKDSIISTVS